MFLANALIWAIFSVLAALGTFLITYEEYRKHFPDKKRPLKMAAQTALTTFAFFITLFALFTAVISLF